MCEQGFPGHSSASMPHTATHTTCQVRAHIDAPFRGTAHAQGRPLPCTRLCTASANTQCSSVRVSSGEGILLTWYTHTTSQLPPCARHLYATCQVDAGVTPAPAAAAAGRCRRPRASAAASAAAAASPPAGAPAAAAGALGAAAVDPGLGDAMGCGRAPFAVACGRAARRAVSHQRGHPIRASNSSRAILHCAPARPFLQA